MGKIREGLKSVFKKGLLHILTGTFLTKIVSFFGSVFLVRVLTKEEYGILGYLENIYGYVWILAGMGLSNTILRYVVLGSTKQEKFNYYTYARNTGFLWNCILILLVGGFSTFYPHPEAYENYVWLLYILLISLPFQYVTDNVLCNERAMFANQRYAVFSFVLTAAVIFGKTMLGKAGGITRAVFGQAFIYILLALFFSYSTAKKYFSGLTSGTILGGKKKEMNLYAIQYMITNGLWAVFMLNDTFLLGRFSTPEVLAEYKVAYTIPGSVTLLSTSIGIFIAPYFVKNENNKEWIKKNFKKAYAAVAAFVGFACMVIMLLAKPIIIILYGKEYLNVVSVMRVLLIAAFLNCGLRYTTANILAAMGRIKYNMIISAIGMILQVLINVQIVPVFGAMGVAITSCVVYGVMAVGLLGIFIKQYYAK